MFFFLSKLLDVFLSPYTWALVFLVLAVPWRRHRGRPSAAVRGWRRRRIFGALGLVILLVFSTAPVPNAMLWRLEHAAPSTYDEHATYDVVILLGGVSDERVVAESGQPAYNDNVERLIETHRLLATNHARFAIVSGAAVDASLAAYGEARVLAKQIADWGIDPSRIVLEEQARNTRENAVHSARIVAERGFSRVLVVTSAFHMRRARECFAAVGMKFDTLSVDFRAASSADEILPRAHHLSASTAILREFAGLYVYRFRGYARPVDP